MQVSSPDLGEENEDSLIKVSSVASTLTSASIRDMIEALIAGERNPRVPAEPARGKMRVKIPALVEALTGQFDDHHAELAAMLLAQIDGLDASIAKLTTGIETLLGQLPDARAADDRDQQDSDGDRDSDTRPGISRLARSSAKPWARWNGWMRSPASARRSPRSSWPRSGWTWLASPPPDTWPPGPSCVPAPSSPDPKSRGGKTGKGNPYLKGVLGTAAAVAAEPTASLANAIGGSSNAGASSRPWSPSPARSWSSSGTCSPIPPPATAIWAPTTTPTRSTEQEDPHPRPATPSTRVHRHSDPDCLTHTVLDQPRSAIIGRGALPPAQLRSSFSGQHIEHQRRPT